MSRLGSGKPDVPVPDEAELLADRLARENTDLSRRVQALEHKNAIAWEQRDDARKEAHRWHTVADETQGILDQVSELLEMANQTIEDLQTERDQAREGLKYAAQREREWLAAIKRKETELQSEQVEALLFRVENHVVEKGDLPEVARLFRSLQAELDQERIWRDERTRKWDQAMTELDQARERAGLLEKALQDELDNWNPEKRPTLQAQLAKDRLLLEAILRDVEWRRGSLRKETIARLVERLK